jgi:hypothetical protein
MLSTLLMKTLPHVSEALESPEKKGETKSSTSSPKQK